MSNKKCEWEWKKLGDVCEVIAGQSPKGSSYNNVGLGMEFHQGKKCFGKKFIEESNVWTTEITKVAEPNDILISVRAPVGPVNFTNRRICIGRGLASIRAIHVEKNYLHQFLVFNESNMTSKTGAVFDSISRSDILNFNIPIPPLAEQERIVKVLDDAFAKIDKIKTNAETNLQNAKDLFQTTLANELSITDDKIKEGWEEVVLDNIVRFTRGPFGGSLKKSCFKKQGYAVYEQQHAIHKHINIRYFIDGDKYQSMSRFAVQSGDLIMSCSGTMGEIFVIPEYAPKGIINQALLKFEIKNDEQREYVVRLLSSSFFKEIMSRNSQGAAIKNVASVAVLKTLKIPLPPLSIQKQIVAKLDSLSEKVKQLESNYKQVIADCDELKKSILKKAFEGLL